MKVMIDIDDKLYKIIKDPKQLPTMVHASRCAEAVENGIPIPKEHGKIIDVSNLLTITEYDGENERIYVPYYEIENAKPIIKADKEE